MELKGLTLLFKKSPELFLKIINKEEFSVAKGEIHTSRFRISLHFRNFIGGGNK